MVSPVSRSLVNPFAAYTAGFALALGVYSLGYSDLYPPLQASLKCFLMFTCAVSLGLAYAVRVPAGTLFGPESRSRQLLLCAGVVAVFVIEVIYSGGLPLLQLLREGSSNFREFGIPVLHVLFSGTCYFLAVYWFDLYVLGQGRIYLSMCSLATATSLLMVSRGAFVVTSIALVAVYVQRRGLNRRLLLSFGVVVAAFLWGFGLLGDIRTHGASGESIILSVGEASDKFLKSNIPTELFWPYLYTSSPLANLQLNITDRVFGDDPTLYFQLEYLPDFISKRFVSVETMEAASPKLITDALTVCTMYGRAFVIMGWVGLSLCFLYFAGFSALCMRVMRRSKYNVATTGILSSMAFLAIFDNMFILSGGCAQLYIALAFRAFERFPIGDGKPVMDLPISAR
jgi:hypothetical protein